MKKITVVDDDPAVRAALAINRSGLGLNVSEATAVDDVLAKGRRDAHFPLSSN